MSPLHLLPLLALSLTLAASEVPWWHHQVVMPVSRVRPADAVAVERVDAEVAIDDLLATTSLTVHLRNRGPRRTEAVLLLPLPAGATVRSFAFNGPGGTLTGALIDAETARRTYRDIVSRMQDPALLEFVGHDLLRSSVFPVEPGATQAVRLSFEHLLTADHGRVDYVLPRSEALANAVPWNVRVVVNGLPTGGLYSPSHALTLQTCRCAALRCGHGAAPVWTLTGPMAPGPLRFGWNRAGSDAPALYTWPDGTGGGCFLLLADAPTATRRPMPRDLTVVVDRSGSMAGDKWRQVTAAVTQILGALGDDERFNLILFNEGVDRFAAGPQPATQVDAARSWLAAARPCGGTNIHDALAEALAQPATPGLLPLVLFLTDGLPTIGQTGELAIRRRAEANPAGRRVFTVGIGADVNAPLVDAIAHLTRARPCHLPPGSDVEVGVAGILRHSGQPVLLAPDLRCDEPGRLIDCEPRRLRDVFAGEQTVVLGRWVGGQPLTMTLSGDDAAGRRLERRITIDPAWAKPGNQFVGRLWASRRIAGLITAIRDLGTGLAPDDQRLRELTTEVVRLSTTWGIMTEYTAFLATEGTPIAPLPMPAATAAAETRFRQDAFGSRSGAKAQFNSLNNEDLREQAIVNPRNLRRDEAAGTWKQERAVQQLADRALYRRADRWVEPAAADRPVARTIAFASAEHLALADRLARSNRQALLAQDGAVQLMDGDEVVLVTAP
jgi:Ca-activated chloride channel family protein